jgi:YgiT-type zinc finger domain-containing protein
MIPFDKCPVCGGEIQEKEVEEVLIGGRNTAILKVNADVYLHCGERLYSNDTIERFGNIRKKLEQEETSDLKKIGYAFQVV